MKIRFINVVEPVNTIFRDLIPFLADQEYDIQVIISDFEYRSGREVSLKQALGHPAVSLDFVQVDFLPLPRSIKWFVVRFIYTVVVAIKTLFGASTDLNIFLTQPPLFALWGYVLKWLRKQPYWVLIMDLYPDIAQRSGVLQSANPITRLLTFISRFTLKHAENLIVIGQDMKAYLADEGIPVDKMSYIPNWADYRIIHPLPPKKNQLRAQLGLNGQFVVLYSGNMGVAHYFDDLLKAAENLADQPDLRFVFIGDGVRRKEIEEAEKLLPNIMLLPFQKHEDLLHSLNLGDVHFISLRTGYEALMVPSKTYSAMLAGRPIIYQGSPKGEIAKIVQEEVIGFVILPHQPEQLETAILQYMSDPELVRQHGLRGRALVEDEMSREQGLYRYLCLIEAFSRRYEDD